MSKKIVLRYSDSLFHGFWNKRSRQAITLLLSLMFFLIQSANAGDQPKRSLNDNMTENYIIQPEQAENIKDIFTNFQFYGRLRANYFTLDRTDEKNSKIVEIKGKEVQGIDPVGFAVGGGIILKTAPFYGLGATFGFYTARNLGYVDDQDIAGGKSGKDTFRREKKEVVSGYTRYNANDINTLAQAYLQYQIGNTDIRAGRQIFESFLTKSNDTKMVPNTFYGVGIESADLPKTLVKVGYFYEQKLRDRNEFHDLMLVDGWDENDDSGKHIGYTKDNGGKDDNKLAVLGIVNKTVPNLKLDFWYNEVPDLFYSGMGEANYSFEINDDFSITPGLRYFQQLNNGLDDITLKDLSKSEIHDLNKDGKISGKADASLVATRVVFKYDRHALTLGFHSNSGEGDIIAPWRGFPTSGYTRTMTEVNWSAGARSQMVKYSWKTSSWFRFALSWAYHDRPNKHGDTEIYHGDCYYTINANAEIKLRILNHRGWGESDFNDARMELNYLF